MKDTSLGVDITAQLGKEEKTFSSPISLMDAIRKIVPEITDEDVQNSFDHNEFFAHFGIRPPEEWAEKENRHHARLFNIWAIVVNMNNHGIVRGARHSVEVISEEGFKRDGSFVNGVKFSPAIGFLSAPQQRLKKELGL